MSLERRRAVLEAILSADDTTAPDRLKAIEALGELDRIQTEAHFTRQAGEPYVERDPQRIEKILQLALEHVGGELIEKRAEARARELLNDRTVTALPGGADHARLRPQTEPF